MAPWILYALLSATSAALVAIFGKIGIARVDSTVATAARAIVMAGAMVAAVLVLGKQRMIGALDQRALFFIVLTGLAGAASWFWYFLALKNGPASGVVAIDRLSVVIVLVFAILFLGERFTLAHALGAALMTLGAFLLIR
jgi:transporter family protein